MSSSDEDKMPLQPKGKKIYSDKYIRSPPPPAYRCKLCTLLLIMLIMLCLAILIIGAVAGVLAHVKNRETNTEPWMSKRLPSDVVPDNYAISLNVDLDSLMVSGVEGIMVDVREDSNWILLQYLDMNISDVSVMESLSGDTVQVSYRPYTENDYLIIENDEGVFSRDCQYHISLKFSYFLYSGGLSGFYNSSYTDNGAKVVIATTQFEPTDARRAFPCFDEPEMKAVFTITIIHPSNRIALSNMPVESSTNIDSSTTETRFQPSKKMSTYLVAFIVCNFESKSGDISSNVTVSVWSRPSLLNDTDFALSTAMKVLEYYQIFFAIDYPLPKMDLVAIPDFRAGAMENWGLITYRETALLYNPDTSSASDKQWVAQVIAHEIAHQWFGNLVTMDWWQDIWLNEGFASYVEYLGTNVSEPSWHYLDFFITGDLRVALDVDGYNDTHPIIQPAETLSEINALFDSISYSKGASLIRMIAGFMGMDKFREGLTKYLNSHRYENAKSSDLWSALEGVSEQTEYNLTAVMDTWTIQAGYPILNVTTLNNCASIHVTQKRFVTIPTESFAFSEFGYIWRIPFSYITDVDQNSGTLWIDDEMKDIDLSKSCKWIKANKGQLGFYRVNYETSMWEMLISELKADLNTFAEDDRANLLDDSISLSIAGMISPMLALDLTSYLKSETDYIPLRSGLLALSQIHTKLILTRVEGHFSKFILCLIKNETQKALQTWPDRLNGNDTEHLHLDNLKRTMVLKSALLYGDSSVGEMAYAQFQYYMNGTVELTPDLKDIIFTAGIKLGGEKEWNYLWNLYTTSNNPTEQAACLSALAYTETPWLIQQYLDKSLTEVRSQDGLTVLRRLAVNVHAWPYLWNFFKEHYDLLFSRYGTSLSFGRAITSAISHFSTQSQLDEVNSFFADRDPGSGEVALKSGIEQIKSNIQWLAVNLDSLGNWLENTSDCKA